MLKTINLTPPLLEQIDRVRRAQRLYPNEDDGQAPLECEQLALARLVVDAYDAQARVQVDRLSHLPVLTTRRAAVTTAHVESTIRAKRRRA